MGVITDSRLRISETNWDILSTRSTELHRMLLAIASGSSSLSPPTEMKFYPHLVSPTSEFVALALQLCGAI